MSLGKKGELNLVMPLIFLSNSAKHFTNTCTTSIGIGWLVLAKRDKTNRTRPCQNWEITKAKSIPSERNIIAEKKMALCESMCAKRMDFNIWKSKFKNGIVPNVVLLYQYNDPVTMSTFKRKENNWTIAGVELSTLTTETMSSTNDDNSFTVDRVQWTIYTSKNRLDFFRQIRIRTYCITVENSRILRLRVHSEFVGKHTDINIIRTNILRTNMWVRRDKLHPINIRHGTMPPTM